MRYTLLISLTALATAMVSYNGGTQQQNVTRKAHHQTVSQSSAAIAAHVQSNYQSPPIDKIDNKGYSCDIELANGLKLKFDSNVRFMGIDD